ncbi:hypothetical protein [Cupriavidus oxalaticus]|jgi:hypothetical protein|uniref:Uncharacterized protein n=1 Tax=Cupriavidus oxalaticus TaxID=96344 RepID=A0A5P3VCA0_9BURK|nr:hypothetical protein [Cupriavidus oxalaticus]QEZ43465.1 hypothetical protein D2917_03920 [Cupriavidus oxalaticus]QRQ85143.1 hypothetical protein JTE91_03405 [Cupriavidus oxalaticus]QRQ90769.1 hypothetical protein JTE92_08940 [Cupriavidus oxalaticus]WQD85294.1 hypothetical protein U0036_27065 [Cupriavidus oxalaticus]
MIAFYTYDRIMMEYAAACGDKFAVRAGLVSVSKREAIIGHNGPLYAIGIIDGCSSLLLEFAFLRSN